VDEVNLSFKLGWKMKSEEDEYVTVRIPKQLADEIDEIIRSKTRGYRTRAEMVKEAIRLRIEQLRFNNSMRTNMSQKKETE
jgi:metal-responsive CopG/Arc/MetJ family transcriptional regulator